MTRSIFLQQVAAHSFAALGVKILGLVIAYATHLALAWIYGPDLMGTFFIATNLVLIASTVCAIGLDNGLLRYAAVLQEVGRGSLVNRLLWQSNSAVMLTSSLFAGGLYLGRFWISAYLHAPALLAMIPWFALALPLFTVMLLCRETLRGLGGVLGATLAQHLVQPGLILAIIIAPMVTGYWQAAAGQKLSISFFASIVATLLVILWRLKLRLPSPAAQSADEKFPWRELWGYSRMLFLTMVLALGLGTMDCLILALFRPPQEVAFYGAALKLATFVLLPLLAVNAILPPLIVRLYEQQAKDELESLVRAMSRLIYYLALPLFLVLSLLSSELLSIFGPGFVTARWALVLLALGQLVNASVGPVFYILNLTGNQLTTLKVQGITLVFLLPLVFYLAYRYGLNGLALTTASGVVFINLFAAWQVWKVLGIKTFANDVTLLSVMAFAAFGLSWGLRHYVPAYGVALIFSVLYTATLLLVIWRNNEFYILSSYFERKV